MDWTNIILGFFTLLSTCAWFVDGRKHRHEVEGLKADNRLKEMDLARQYVRGFEEAVCNPLRQQVAELKPVNRDRSRRSNVKAVMRTASDKV